MEASSGRKAHGHARKRDVKERGAAHTNVIMSASVNITAPAITDNGDCEVNGDTFEFDTVNYEHSEIAFERHEMILNISETS